MDHNGNVKTKKKLGGAYPGQRRPNHQPYAPPASDFGKDGQATVHFVAYGGGNALTLVKKDGSSQPQSGAAEAQFIQGKTTLSGKSPVGYVLLKHKTVTLPAGVSAGDTIHVKAPDGRVNAIIVPEGFGPGSTFTVEFAPEEKAKPPAPAAPPAYAPATAATTTAPPPSGDDGFASGFNNPHWRPTASAVPSSEPEVTVEPDIAVGGAYPTTSATPLYHPK